MSTRDLTILLVEDDPFARAMLEQILTDKGYRVKMAQNGLEGLRIFYEGNDVDLIITDMNMPKMDGLELIQELRDAKQDVPIIVLTSNLEIKTAVKAIYGGANAYLIKDENIEDTFGHAIDHAWDHYQLAREKDRLMAELEEKNRKLEQLSYLDGLTGISNRRYFDAIITKEWRRSMRDHSPISIAMIDIDYFKLYNDTYGHQNGDDCLKKVAHALKDALFRPGDFIARYGGEEFVAVMTNIGLDGALEVASRMQHNIKRLTIPHELSEVSELVTVSIGLACTVPQKGSESTQLIGKADNCLYNAKKKGRNKICSSDDNTDSDD
ncbi:diguanylate cyclase (GGDEF) domain-containing protein [Desulfocicer vacuolatum DSM 3385]|uniref:diguanylate cyclase n=1 Tax=Desulfocicer vacuolatum DSM 3385 TaxID=1121400 RepID=A0A1W2AK58_9BACT|nr:diguanylate cyclase [Desulfocicer vacuolatum]SMC61075.1 diguanylate cyclase (GGDEF) domain-containing protein [Desulfocicer vacuolatum DSM 3385]